VRFRLCDWADDFFTANEMRAADLKNSETNAAPARGDNSLLPDERKVRAQLRRLDWALHEADGILA
jgi:hypothetical protein